MANNNITGIRGPMLTFRADPFLHSDPRECYDFYPDGLIVVGGDDGHIVDVGDYRELSLRHGALCSVDSYDDNHLIIPGLIDAHAHYVQTPMIASRGGVLIEWLDSYTFPAESRFADRAWADEVARVFFRQLLSHGTTTANVFATTFAESVDAFFEESMRYDTLMISGKVLQNRNLPEALRDRSAEESVELSERLLQKWHGRGRQLYAVVPRFAPTSTDRQLQLAGELYQRYVDRGVYMHTHLDEAADEIAWVRSLYPDARDYVDVYDRFGLVDRRSVFAHCCIVDEQEWRVLAERECGVVTCPSSNLFLGDGLFDFAAAKEAGRPCRVAVGTDVGGGTNFSIIRQLGDAYKAGMTRMYSLDALRGFYLATRGGAEALHLADRIGSLEPGLTADIAVVDLHPTEFAQWRMRGVESIFDKLFILQTLQPDNLIEATYVAGRKVFDRRRPDRFRYAPSRR